ncbi:MAG: 23S rRNA (guanosine(2251)-2'-O)-methyltransferase RlmB [Elusimicrobiales bacterium]|nr:23S rRNA (guanosine(2251)-2'-O)-methyltransferase RlmB [Elusimicrobiales bacterium]
MAKYIYGINTIREVLDKSKRKIYRLIVENSSGSKLMDIIKIANKKKIPVQFAPKRLLDKLTSSANHQNIVLEIDEVKFYSIDEAVEEFINKKNLCWLAVDSVTDPQNFGSIIRNAVCFGFSAVIFSQDRNCQISPTVEKIASGAVELVKFIRVVNLNASLQYLKSKGFWVYGSSPNGVDVRKINFNFPIILVVGSEGEGIRVKTLQHCDEIVSIPQIKEFDSLNVSAASAILMYEIRRRI